MSKFSTVFGFVSSKWLLHRHNAEKAKVWPKRSQNVRISLPHVPSVPSSNLYASKLSLRFLAHGPTPILIFPSPGPARTAALRPQFAFEASKCDFFAFQKSSYFLLSFFLEKIAKINDFGRPKLSQNPFKMPSKSMSHKTCIFSSIFCLFWLFSALCTFSSKCLNLKPSKNCGLVALRAYQHCVFVGT